MIQNNINGILPSPISQRKYDADHCPFQPILKDLRLAKSQGLDLTLLEEVVNKLARQEVLDAKYHDYALQGSFRDFRECHIKSDWLLVYSIDDEELELFLFRTGTHSDLFE